MPRKNLLLRWGQWAIYPFMIHPFRRVSCMSRQAICNLSKAQHTSGKYFFFYVLSICPTIYIGNRQITPSLVIFSKLQTLLCNTPELRWGSSVFIWQDMCRAKQKKASKNISWCSLHEPEASAKMQCLTLKKLASANWTDFFDCTYGNKDI